MNGNFYNGQSGGASRPQFRKLASTGHIKLQFEEKGAISFRVRVDKFDPALIEAGDSCRWATHTEPVDLDTIPSDLLIGENML